MPAEGEGRRLGGGHCPPRMIVKAVAPVVLLLLNLRLQRMLPGLAMRDPEQPPSSPPLFAAARSGWGSHYSARDGGKVGVLSDRSASDFRSRHDAIDREDGATRCRRYGAEPNEDLAPGRGRRRRRIFYGALIADEPMELWEAVAAESRGVYDGLVLVESNRTQNFTPRGVRFATDPGSSAGLFGELFGVPPSRVLVVDHASEDTGDWDPLVRENWQREEIRVGWKRLGMRPDDVGLIADPDETLSRDLLRAAQSCQFPAFDHERNKCGGAKLIGNTLVFESSPECATAGRQWYHPDMVVGHCIDGIGNVTDEPRPEQYGYHKIEGCGESKNRAYDFGEHTNITRSDGRYPPYNAYDFRMRCGGRMISNDDESTSLPYVAFHFHNFFADERDWRFKYNTYGHPWNHGVEKRLEDIHDDLALMVRCVKDLNESGAGDSFRRVEGGYASLNSTLPLYFEDPAYRSKRHALVGDMVTRDEEAARRVRFGDSNWEDLPEDARDAARLLGFNRSSWDDDVYPLIFRRPAREWTAEEAEAAEFLMLEREGVAAGR